MAPKTSKTAPVAKAGAKTAAKAAAKAAPKAGPKAGARAASASASTQKRKADETPTPEQLKHRQQVFLTHLRDNMTKCKNAQKAEEAKNVYERYRSNTDPEAKREMVNSFCIAGGKVKGLQVPTGHTPPPFPFFGVWVGFVGGQICTHAHVASMPMLHACPCCPHYPYVHSPRCCMNSRWRPAKMTPRRGGALGHSGDNLSPVGRLRLSQHHFNGFS